MQSSMKRSLMLTCAVLLTSADALAQESNAQPSQVQGVSINGLVLTEDSCDVLASTKGQKPELREVPGMHVLDKTKDHPLAIESIGDVKLSGIVCWRSEARLAPNDYLVPTTTGLNLYMKTDTGDEAKYRTIALERAGGSLRVRLLSGPGWTPTEEAKMAEAIRQFIKRSADGT